MRCDLSSNPLEEDYLLDGVFMLNQESLELEQIRVSSIIIVVEFFLYLFELKMVNLLGFNLGVVVNGLYLAY